MTDKLDSIGLKRLVGVHPHLVAIVKEASKSASFRVVEGLRTLEKQREYFRAGKSRTMRSRHLRGFAVDLVPYQDFDNDGDMDVSWEPKHFKPIAVAMKGAAKSMNITIEWGGDWKSFVDMPHFQLPKDRYPD